MIDGTDEQQVTSHFPPLMIEQVFTGHLLCFLQSSSKPAFHSGTLTVFATHTSSNPVFLQGLIQIDTLCSRSFITCLGKFSVLT